MKLLQISVGYPVYTLNHKIQNIFKRKFATLSPFEITISINLSLCYYNFMQKSGKLQTLTFN